MHSRSCEHSRGMFSLPETSPAACHCTVCNVERDCAFCYRILCGWDCVSSNSAALGNREETQTEHPPTECLFSTSCICMWQFELQAVRQTYAIPENKTWFQLATFQMAWKRVHGNSFIELDAAPLTVRALNFSQKAIYAASLAIVKQYLCNRCSDCRVPSIVSLG